MEQTINFFRSWIGHQSESAVVQKSSARDTATTELVLPTRQVVTFLAVVAGCLLFLSLAGDIAVSSGTLDSPVFTKFAKAFSVDRELNVPAFFSMLLLLASALLLSCVALVNRNAGHRDYRYWAVLAAGFCFMALDEIAEIHEKLIDPMRTLLGGKDLGVLYFAWVVPAIGVVVLCGCFFFRFWLRLSPRIRFLIFVAACLYLGGAIGVELIDGKYAEIYGKKTVVYSILTTIEEGLEMAGSIVFIVALLAQIALTTGGRISFGLANGSPRSS